MPRNFTLLRRFETFLVLFLYLRCCCYASLDPYVRICNPCRICNMFAQRQSFTIEQEQAVYRDSQIDKLIGKQETQIQIIIVMI